MVSKKWLLNITYFIFSSLVILGFQDCSKVRFTSVDSTEKSSVQDTNISTLPIDGGVPVMAISGTVQLYTQINQCNPFSNCVVDYFLKEAKSEKLEFTWQTNDLKYLDNSQKYAQPGKHFVSSSGTVVFNAGETHKQIIIQSLSGFTVGMEIPFLWNNCIYGQKSVDCRSILIKP